MSLKSILFAAAIPFAAACASDDLTTGTPEEPVFDEALEGTTGEIAVEFPWGVQTERYQVIDGFVVIRGDIIVKRADQLHQRANARVGGRWPNNQVRYAFDTNYPAQAKTNVRDAVEALEAELPIDFIEIDNPCSFPSNNCATNYILMRNWTNNWGQSATPSGGGQVGMLGGQQIINSDTDFSVRGYQHEFLHALGMYHEQERSDRDSFVQFRPECVKDDDADPDPSGFLGNFGKNNDPAPNFGTYDFSSIMHYDSDSFSLPDAQRAMAPCNNHWPLERIAGSCPLGVCTDEDDNGSREFIDPDGTLSAGDVDAVWAMYGQGLAAHESGDQFATSIVFGDFDADGREDLAFGIPGENTVNDTVSNAGAVAVFKGTAEGFQPWKLITQTSIGAIEEANDGVGTSLAVGDFNDDGIDDLAIGAPGESVGNSAAYAGAVYMMQGTAGGLAYWRAFTQSDIGAAVEGGDRFGHALAAGDFNGDGKDDLAIGSIGESHNDNIAAGHVYVLRGTGSSLTAWASLSQASQAIAPNVGPGGILPPPLPLGTHQASDLFGSALAAGRIDDDNIDDLAIAANCDSEVAACAGGVYLFRGSASGMRGWMRVQQSTGDDAYDRFGWALATGDVDMDGDDDVLIGAPYDDYNGAFDVGRVYMARPNGHVIQSVSTMTQAQGDHATGDLFGSSIAFGTSGAFDVFAVGARNEAWGDGPQAGAVFLYTASDSGNPTYDTVVRASPGSDELAEDAFGSSVAVFTDGGKDYLIVGNPLEDASAGNAQVFIASPSGWPFAQGQVLAQNTKGTRAP